MGNIDIFNRMANQYDSPERSKIAAIIATEIQAQLGDVLEKTALDYGCGTGLVGLALLDSFASILFVDAAFHMIEVVREKISKAGIKNAETYHGNIMADDFSPIKTDYFFLVQTLLHIPDTESILSKIYDLLETGGQLLMVDFDKNPFVDSPLVHPGFDQQQLATQLERLGFKVISRKTFYHGEKMFMNEDASLFILQAVKI